MLLLELCPLKGHMDALTLLVLVNVTLCGDQVSADVIKLRCSHWGGPLIHDDQCPQKKRDIWTQTRGADGP